MNIGFALCGSFCTFDRVLPLIKDLTDAGHDITPILSFQAAALDTRFGTAASWIEKLAYLTGHPPMRTLTEVEPIGPQGLFDLLVVAPCTGTTLGKLACGISDTPVALAVKSHLRRSRPVILGISTNDALGASMRNIAVLKNSKHIYFIPMRQDDPVNKPNSLVADFSKLPGTVDAAMAGNQVQPLFTTNA